MISMHSRTLMCIVNKQGMFKEEKKWNTTLYFSCSETSAGRGRILQRVLPWRAFPPVSCLTLLISHSKNSGKTQVCTAAWGEDDWWLVVMMFGILPTPSLLAHWSCECCSTYYRLLLKGAGIRVALLHCHTVEPENLRGCNVHVNYWIYDYGLCSVSDLIQFSYWARHDKISTEAMDFFFT